MSKTERSANSLSAFTFSLSFCFLFFFSDTLFVFPNRFIFQLIVKNFKDLTVKVAMEHYGHRVLLALFDTIDDTVLLNKYITSVCSFL